MTVTNIKSYWSGGNLIFADNSGTDLFSIESDGTIDIKVTGKFNLGGAPVTATAAEINKALDLSANTLEVTTTAATAVTSAITNVEFNLSSGAGVTTIPDLADHQGDFFIKQTGASTSGASVTATAGTWDGTNNIATTNAANEALLVRVDSAGNGTIIENVGSVVLSS